MLSSSLRLLNEAEEVALALMEALLDGLDWVLRELLILHNEVMQVISEVISTRRASMAIKDTEEADLWPLDIKIRLVLRFEDV